MVAELDANVRKALGNFGGTFLAYYALIYSIFYSVFLVFLPYVHIGIPLPFILLILLIPNLLLIIMHLFYIYRSIGRAGWMLKDSVLRKSTRYFLGGALEAITPTIAYLSVYLFFPGEIYAGFNGNTVIYAYAAFFSAYWVINRKALGLLWLWISRYVEDHPADAGKLDIITLHPKGRLMVLTFKAVFGEGEIRARAAEKLAYYAIYQERDEEDEGDIQTKDLAIEIAPKGLPFHSRDITDGKCPNCGALVASPNDRYCTKCGETFRGTW